METTIKDDFSLNRIVQSGQCFRVPEFPDGTYRFVTGSHILYIKETAPQQYELSCGENEWQNIWWDYFDFGRDYQSIRNSIPTVDSYMKVAAAEGNGIRFLRQDLWEMLITFIISQRKSIPAIKNSIEMLCRTYGNLVHTDRETLWLFPPAEQLYQASDSRLQDCKLGYRIGYIRDAVAAVYEHRIDLSVIDHHDDIALFTELKSI